MNQDLNLFAEALVFVHGNMADAEAARHVDLCEKLGEKETAETWRKLRRAVHELAPKLAA